MRSLTTGKVIDVCLVDDVSDDEKLEAPKREEALVEEVTAHGVHPIAPD